MSRTTYAPKQTYTGTGSLSAYTFNFKIEADTQLEVIEYDDNNVETQRVRGDDVVYLSSVDFDAVDGGGTVNLASNLPTDYTLVILLANDSPTQDYLFKNKGDFTLKKFENALDFVVGAVMRLAYRGRQAIRLADVDDQDTVDMQLKTPIADATDKYIKVNSSADGVEYGKSESDLVDDAAAAAEAAVLAADIGTIGGFNVGVTQTISSGGKMTLDSTYRAQVLKVQGNSASIATANAPFSTTPTGGKHIIIFGTSDAFPVTIPYANVAGGCMLRGDRTLYNGDSLELVYDSGSDRYREIGRNT